MTRVPARLVLAAAVALAAPASSAGLPEWARPYVDTELPAIAALPARVLFSEERVEVERDGALLVRRRLAAQALTTEAADLPLGYFPFDDRTEILRSKAWHLPQGGRARGSSSGAIDLAIDSSFLSDSRVRFLHVPGIERGSLVFFEFEARDRPYVLVRDVVFGQAVPVELARFEIVVPRGWSARYAWLRHDALAPRVSGDSWSWELRGLTAPTPEPLGPSPGEVAPRLVVSIAPPADVPLGAVSLGDWGAFGDWYERLASGRAAVTPQIQAAMGTALDGVSESALARASALARFARDRVRYVAKEIGISGYRPRPATDVLGQRWGDCKDKGTLLRALLAAAGQNSLPILVNASESGTVAADVPSPGAFDHFVVGLAIPPSSTVPAELAWSVVDAGPLGPLLIVDVTDEWTSFGALPDYLLGKTTLVLAGEQSRLVTVPPGDPAAHRVEHRLAAELTAGGAVHLALDILRYGAAAADARARWTASSRDFLDASARAWREHWPDVVVADHAVRVEDPDGAFAETLKLERRGVPEAQEPTPLDLFPQATDALPRVPLTRRVGPIVYPHPLRITFATSLRGFPDGAALPASHASSGDGWSVTASATREGELLRGSYELNLSRQRFDPDSFAEIRKLWSAASRAAALAVPRVDRSTPAR